MTTRGRTIGERVAESQRGYAAHKIASATPGRNRYQPGRYVCTCGETFTGMNAFEEHRADRKRDS